MAKTSTKPLPELSWFEPRLRISRVLSLVSLAALAILLVAWNLYFTGLNGALSWVVMAVALSPLAIIALGIILGSEKTHIWACILINIYFVHGVLASLSASNAWLGYLEIFISAVLFFSAFMHTLWSFKYNRKLAGEV